MPPVPYAKPWLPHPDQLKLLQGRGLRIDDFAAAESFLRHVNYYRFAGYCLAFEVSRHSFAPGIAFEDVREAYIFDCELRDIVTDALEVIEVDLRTAVAHSFGKKYGAFGHTKSSSFHPRFDHSVSHRDWLSRLQEEVGRSSELFVTHFRSSYLEFPDLPVWVSSELMSFGSLSRMISGLTKDDRRDISSTYGLSPQVLASLVHHLVYVRNLCAHHCRLWDKSWSLRCTLPDNADWRAAHAVDNRKVFSTLLLMRHIQKRSPYLSSVGNAWKGRVENLLDSALPKVHDPFGRMGVPASWKTHPIWM